MLLLLLANSSLLLRANYLLLLLATIIIIIIIIIISYYYYWLLLAIHVISAISVTLAISDWWHDYSGLTSGIYGVIPFQGYGVITTQC